MKFKNWHIYTLITVSFWGVWGALIEIPEKAGFPATLGYTVWAFTMIPPAIIALKLIKWKLEYDKKSIFLGTVIGFTGAGGQLLLFQALRTGPAYLVFPIISVSPVITILLSYWLLKERTNKKGWLGIVLALVAILFLSYQPPQEAGSSTSLWLGLSLLVFFAWGFQAYVMKFANESMKAESIFFYMMVTGLLLIPFALSMTDFSLEINWSFKGPYLAAMIQILNAVGALCLVYALRYGKAIIVSPLINAGAPVLTILISLAIYQVIPNPVIITGMALAIFAAYLMTD